ncbi:MAG: sigma-70 family RNA polymerase sigma factor [Planctomycetota bacterium]
MEIEELLAHSRFLRALARTLIRDEQRADDIVQETWVSAVRNPPRQLASVRGWLAKVVRNAARQELRRDSRRLQREERAALPERGPSPEDILERESTRRRLVDAVTALEEPYRCVVLLRYFEGFQPRKIARQLDTPVETVKTRLKRAIEKLRVQLDGEFGERRTWISALLPLTGWKIEGAAVAAGGVALGWTMKVAVAVLVTAGAVSLTILPLPEKEERAPQATTVAEAASESASAEAAAVSSSPRAATESRALARETVEPASRDDAAVAPVKGRVIDTDERPIEGASIHVYPEAHPETILSRAESTADGSYQVVVPTTDESLFLRVEKAGYAPFLCGDPPPGQTITALLRRGGAFYGQVTEASAGLPIAGAKTDGIFVTTIVGLSRHGQLRMLTDGSPSRPWYLARSPTRSKLVWRATRRPG